MALTITNTRTASVGLLTADSPVSITASGTVLEAGTSAALAGQAIVPPWIIDNQGMLQSAQGEGILIFSGGTITNGGTANATASIAGGLQGIETGGASRVVNYGSVSGIVQFGVWLGAGGTVVNGDATHTAARISGGGNGVLVAGGAGTITNGGTIAGSGGSAISLFAGGSVTNGGTANSVATLIGGVDGVHAFTVAADVTNAGTITGTAGIGVELEGGGTLSNVGLFSRIQGAGFGALLLGVGEIDNEGAVTASAPGGVGGWIGADGTINNASTASRMQGGAFGAIVSGQGRIANSGTLIGDATFGAWIAGSGTLSNGNSLALLSGGSAGAIFSGASGSIDNAGTIFGGTLFGALMAGQGSVTNSVTGTIEGVGNGLVVGSGLGTVANSGTIVGDSSFGLWLSSGGTLTNNGTRSLVAGGSVGLLVTGGAGTVGNAGTIRSNGLIGAAVLAGGTLTNGDTATPTARISGVSFGALLAGSGTELFNYGTVRGAYAVYAGDAGAPETVHNFGTLASPLGASGYALYFATAGNTLDIRPGAVFTGKVDLGGGTMRLAGGTIALSGLGGQFQGISTLSVAPSSVLNLSGANTLAAGATLAAGSTINLAPGATLDLRASLAGGGTTDVFSLGGSARLALGAAAAGGGFAAEIDNFGAGNRIDIAGLTPNGAITAAIGPGNSIVLSDQSGTLYTLGNIHLAPGQAPGLVAGTEAGNVFLTAVAPGGDVVLQWDNITRAAITGDAGAAPAAARALAIESLAVYDTMQALQGLPGYSVTLAAAPGSDTTAALASAAASVLKALYPAQSTSFDAMLAANLSAIPASQAKTDGIALGQAIAQRELALRANDGAADVDVYVGTSAVGAWRPTGPSFTPGAVPQYAHVTPFALSSQNQFAPPSVPALDSPAYAASVNQVQSLGARDSVTRTADQTQIAKFWNDQTGTDTPPGQWNQIAATVATTQHLTVAQNARLFALLNVSLADAGIAAWNAKYAYSTWRPITAIQLGGTGNVALTADPTWQPLLTTPNHPEYIAGHGTFSGAAATILASVFGDATSFSATSQSLPGVTRNYTSFSQAALEASMSRVYGGIHFDFSVLGGETVGTNVANWTLAQFGNGSTPIPRILLTSASGHSFATNPSITGQVNAAAGTTLQVTFDGGGTYSNVTLDATGAFQVQPTYLTDGSADGAHAIYFRATDPGLQKSEASFGFVLASQGPRFTLDGTSLQDNGTLTAASVISGLVAPAANSSITRLTYAIDGGTARPIAFDQVTHGFSTGVNLFGVTAGAHTIALSATDAAGNIATLTLHETLASAPFRVASLTPDPLTTDVGVTYRPMITFTRAVNPTTITADSFYVTDSTGARVPASVAPLAGGAGAWLLPTSAWPGGSTLTLHVDASLIKAADGTALDISGMQTSGAQLLDSFTTVATAVVPGTTITGLVVDPGPDNTPLTPDDVSNPTGSSANFPLNNWKLPLAGVKVYILGHEDQAVVTDATGHFTLSQVPSGNVKLAIDGRTAANAPAGFFFPEMVYDLDIIPGVANSVGSALGAQAVRIAEQNNPSVYLPRIPTDTMTPISATQPTTVHAPADAGGASGMNLTATQLSQLSITLLPGSILDANGNPVVNPTVGISPVPTALVKDMLPPGLEQHTFDITVQTPGGAVLNQPATLSFPNVFGLAPGEKTYMVSFNHTTGLLEIDGTGTASADGKTVTTDPGSGVIQPGWHGYTDPKSRGKTKIVVKNPKTGLKEIVWIDSQQAQTNLADTLSKYATNSGYLSNVVNTTDFAARQFEHEFAKRLALQTGRFAPIGLGIDGAVLANDTRSAYNDLAIANQSGSLVDGLAVAEDGIKVLLDTAITGLDYATLGGVATAETGVGAIEAVAAQGLKDVINGISIGITLLDFGAQYAGDYVANHFDNAGNSNANILGPKFDPDLILRMSEDAWNGDAQITVSIDGVQVLGPTAITALRGVGSPQNVTISGILGTEAHTVKVTLVNGASGDGANEQRNAYIQSANFNGQEFAFSTPLYGAGATPASATFSVGSVITPQQVRVDTVAQTNQNEFAFQKAIRVRQLAHLNAMLPTLQKYDTNLLNNGLNLQDVQNFATDFKAFLDEAALIGGHPHTGQMVGDLVRAVSTGVSALYGNTFQPYNPAPVNIPALTPQQIADRDAAFAAGQPYTQIWTVATASGSTGGGSAGGGGGGGGIYTYYPPGQGQQPLGARSFALLTAADGTQERFAFDPAKGIDRLMAPNTFYKLDAFDPQTGAGGSVVFVTGTSGTDTNIPDLPYINDGATTLADGLTAFQAHIIGVDPSIASNLIPGLTDLAALKQGLFNTTQLPTATGIQAALPMNGEAKAIALVGTSGTAGSGRTLALLATGSHGMAVVDITQPLKPALLGQLKLFGDATDIAVDGQRQVAAVANGAAGLALVSYATPNAPSLLANVSGQYTHVVVRAGVAYASTGGTVQAFDISTGDLLAELAGANGSITGLAIDRGTLYTMDTGHTLRAISLANGGLTLQGSIALPGGGNGLVVGNGIATVPVGDGAGNGGYLTVNVSNPASPALIAGAANLGNAGEAVALNGSGLGLFTGRIQVFAQGLQPELDVVNTSDPADTGARTQRYLLPATPGGVAISGGLGFVADGTAGLQVVRYQAFTPNAVAPTVTITAPPADVDLSTPGTQVIEGASIGLDVAITSPGQVLSVEVLLDGHSVVTDLQYPFNLGLSLPTIAQNGTSAVSLAVRATDTNGNVTTSTPIAIDLVADPLPPTLVSASIADGSVIATTAHQLRFTFNKALDPASATAANFTLRTQGGIAIAPTSVALEAGGRTVTLVYPDLVPATYSFTLNAPGIRSAAGVALGGTPSTIGFSTQLFSKTWETNGGGDWNTGANWNNGTVPNATDAVFIGARQPVTVAAASAASMLVDRAGQIDQTAGGLTIGASGDLANGTLRVLGGAFVANGPVSVGRLTLSGGSMSGTGTVTVNNSLAFSGGTMNGGLRTIVGANAAATLSGGASLATQLDVAGTMSLSGAINLGAATAGTLSILTGGIAALAGSLGVNLGAGGSVANAGTLQSGGGTLVGIAVANAGGTLLATDGGVLDLQSAQITGGTLASLGSGLIRSTNRTPSLSGVAIAPGSTVQVTNNNYLAITGTIANAGTLSLASFGNDTALQISGTTTLTGAGQVLLGDISTNRISSDGATALLVNRSRITGAGNLGSGDGALTFNNQGTVNATGGTTLLISSPNLVTNSGTLMGSGGGGLLITGTSVNNAGGTLRAANGSRVDLQSAVITGGILATAGTGLIRSIDRTPRLDGVAIAAGATVQVTNNNYLAIAGTIDNAGTLLMSSVGNDTALLAVGTVTLSGAGTLVMSDISSNRIISNGSAATIDIHQLIQGAGNIGSADPLLTVRNFSTVSATGGTALLISSPNTVINNGTLLGGGAGMLITGTSVNNAGGLVKATDGSRVDLQSAVITGGTLATAGTGLIRIIDRTPLLSGVAIAAGSTVQLTNNNYLAITGTIANAGTLSIASVGNDTALLASGTATLAGPGLVVLSDSTANRIGSNGAAATLDIRQPLQGAGNIGSNDPLLTIRNFSTVSATGGNALLLISPNPIINNGVLEGTGPGALRIESTTINGNGGGVIRATGTGAHVDLVSATIDGGSLLASGGGVIQAIDRGSVLIGTGLAGGSSLVVTNNNILTLRQQLNTGATITLASVGNYTALQIDGGVTLQAGGLVQLTDNGANRIIGGTGSSLTNGGTIQGAGALGDGAATLVVTNGATGTIDANVSTALQLTFAGGTLTNAGLLKASGGGGMLITGTTIEGAGILRSAASHIDFASATLVGGTLEASGGGSFRVTDRGSLARDLTIDASAALTVLNNEYLTLAGTLHNAGTLAMASVGNDTAVLIAGTVALQGAGAVTMSDINTNRFGSNGAPAKLILQQPLSGSGSLGSADPNLTLQNLSTITANNANALTINMPQAVINGGLLRATGSSHLLILSTTIDSTSGGMIEAAGNGAAVDLQSASLTTGLLKSSGGGLIRVTDRGSVIQNVTIDTGAEVFLTNNNYLTIGGTIENNGTLSMHSAGNDTALLTAGTVTLQGAGVVTLSDAGANRLGSNGATAKLVLKQPLSGGGSLGAADANFTLENQGTISATTSSALVLNSANPTVNSGTLQASAGSHLVLSGTTVNNAPTGLIAAVGSGAVVDIQSATITGGTLASSGGGVIQVDTRGNLLQDASLAAGSTLNVLNNEFLTIAGTIQNQGVINLLSAGNDTALLTQGTVTLAGAGTVALSDAGANRLGSSGAPARLILRQNLSGGGQIGAADPNFTMENHATISATTANPLVINPANPFLNDGTLRAAPGSHLSLSSTTIDNTTGTITASGAGSVVDLASASLSGGVLSTTGGGVVSVNDRGSALTGMTIAAGSAVAVNNNQFLRLAGTITNNGTIALNSGGNDTALLITGSTTLAGAGLLTATDASTNRIGSDGAAATLTNAETMSGAFRIGNGDPNLAFVNSGTITTSAGNGIVINTPGAGVTNSGTIIATTAGAGVTVSAAMLNTGLLLSAGAPVFIAGNVTGTGNDRIEGNSALEFGAAVAAGQTVTFAAGSTGTLKLDAASSFAATIAGLATDASNRIDLISLAFAPGATALFAGNASGGTLTVTSGAASVALALTGDYTAINFTAANDGANHTLITAHT